MRASDFTSFRAYLKEEKNQLDKVIEYVDSNVKEENLSNIDIQINNLQNALMKERKFNIIRLEKYLFFFKFSPYHNEIFFRLKYKIQKEEIKRTDNKILFDYIEIIINKLEKKIAAESISKITSVDQKNGNVVFETHFEDPTPCYNGNFFDSQAIEELDKCRENSLFSIYTIAHKSPFSLISQNVLKY